MPSKKTLEGLIKTYAKKVTVPTLKEVTDEEIEAKREKEVIGERET